MEKRSILFLILGVGVIFFSVYIFTRPALFDVWDFSDKGQIGDTIGGITAPIINLTGAFLVYISFQAQVNANKIQTDALNNEKLERNRENSFDKQYNQLLTIKSSLTDLEFVVKVNGTTNPDGSITQPVYHVFKGVNAIQESLLRLEAQKKENSPFIEKYTMERYNTYGTFLSFQFILSSIFEFIEQVESNIANIEDKNYLISNIQTFYNIYLKRFAERLLAVYSPGQPDVEFLGAMKDRIDEKFSAK